MRRQLNYGLCYYSGEELTMVSYLLFLRFEDKGSYYRRSAVHVLVLGCGMSEGAVRCRLL